MVTRRRSMSWVSFPAIIAASCLFIYTAGSQPVKGYEKFLASGTMINREGEAVVLRKFERSGHSYFLTVSPQTLDTSVTDADSIRISPASMESLRKQFSGSPYFRALQESESNDKSLLDAGITHVRPDQKGIDLTIDLCPSQRPLDRIVFTNLTGELGKIESPVPVAISVTGKWILRHPSDLKWLDSLRQAGILRILWINHTYNHFTSKTLPLDRNFMLEKGTDVNSEILLLEAALVERNLLPSVFFRFPGLVSDKEVFDKVLDFGLIPVGSDAWLAKGQWPKNGSIVLIHANGNEPAGVRDFIQLLNRERQDVMSKKWELYDLRESIVEEEKK